MSIDDLAADLPGSGRKTWARPGRDPHIDAAGFGAWQWSMSSNEVILSACAEQQHGVAAGSFAGTFAAFSDLIHPEDRDRTIASFFQAFAAGTDHFVEYRTTGRDGPVQWVFTWVSPLTTEPRGEIGLTGICLSNTLPHHADHLFQEAQDQIGVVLDGVSDGITIQTPGGDFVYGNEAASRILGIRSIAELRSLPVPERQARYAAIDETGEPIPGDQLPTSRALRGEFPDEMLIQFQPIAGGDRRWVNLKSTPIIDEAGAVRFIVNRLRDMTEERRRQGALSDSEARYRLLFESNPMPMWVFDIHTLRFLAVNDAAIYQYGWSREEFLALTLLDIRPPNEQPAILDKLAHITADPDGLDVAGVWRHRRRDGTEFDAEVTTHAILLDNKEARVSLAINVTERTLHERRLERLSALTAALSAALSPREVAKVIGQYARSAGSDAAAVASYSPVDQSVTVLHRTGYPEHIAEQSGPFPVDTPSVLGHVIRTREPIIAPTWDEFDQEYPALVPSRRFAGEAGLGAGLILPLQVDDRAIGAIKMAFREPRVFSQTLLDELQTIAYLCGQALERAQLYAAEQQARARAEIGELVARREAARTELMAELSRTLAEAGLDYNEVLAAVARTTAEYTGDACAISIFDEAGGPLTVDTIHHHDPIIRGILEELIATAWQPAIAAAGERIAATGEAVLAPTLGGPAFTAGGDHASTDAVASADPARVHSLMILPFRAHGRITGAMALLRLTPDRPYTETDLAFFQELSDRAALSLDNARLYHEAQVALRARDEFLSAAAHELRTPVTTVKGYAQMLLRAQVRAHLASDRASQFLQAIDESTDRLRVLTDDLLDVSRLRLGQMPLRLQALDLVELTAQMMERYETRFAPRHTLSLASDVPAAVVTADPDRIDQVLSNLLENAAKYSPAGGEISTTIATDAAGVRISISDSGIGLPADFQERIFEPFNRGDNAIRDNVPGLGLGLYICDSIVRRHGGVIDAESAGEGLGTTFHLWLPYSGPSGSEAGE